MHEPLPDSPPPTATPFPARRNRWLPLWLLITALLIATAGGLLWAHRAVILSEYHFSQLLEAIDRNDEGGVADHLYAIYELAPDYLDTILQRARSWPADKRAHIVDLVSTHPDFLKARSEYDPFDGPTGRVFAPLRLLTPAAMPKVDLDLLLKLDEKNEEVLRLVAERFYRQRDYRACARTMERLIRFAEADGHTGTARDYALWGSALHRLDRFEQAQSKYEMAALMQPRSYLSLGPLVTVLEQQGRYSYAIRASTEMLAKAREAFPGIVPLILLERGQMLGLVGRHDLALIDFQAARALQQRLQWLGPEAVFHLRLSLAQSLIAMHEPEQALKELDVLLQQQPADSDVLRLRACALEDLRRYPEAIRHLRDALLAHAKSPNLYNHLAWILATAKDPACRNPQEALALAQRAVAMDGERTPAYLDTLAEAHYVNRHFAQAVEFETLAVAKGGEIYRPALNRYLQALAEQREGKTVMLTDSPLVDHGRLPRSKAELVIESLPAPARVPIDEYRAAVERALQARASVTLDVLARLLAQLWLKYPRTAIEDPKADLHAMAVALRRLHWSAPQNVTPRDRTFLLHFAHAFPSKDRSTAVDQIGVRDFADPVPLFAYRSVDLILKAFSRTATAAILTQLAKGRLRLSEFYLADYYSTDARHAEVPWRTPTLSADQKRAVWAKIEARLRLAAKGRDLPVLPQLPAPPRRVQPTPRGLAPPPDDGSVWGK